MKRCGRSTLTGTGTKTILTPLTGIPLFCELTTIEGNNICTGSYDGTNQVFAQNGPSGATGSSKVISLTDASGTLVMEGTVTFGTSGGSGTILVNLTTNTAARGVTWKAEN